MNKDSLFLGLFALAYLYLDARPASALPSAEADAADAAEAEELPQQVRAPSRLLPVRFPARAACPRNHVHAVSLRSDGAIWCLGCDEGFYPQVTIWDSIMGGVAA